MISKISYIKLIREDIRHRGWLAALSGVLLFLSMPVYTLIYLDSYSEDPEVLKEFADTFSGFINGYNSAFLIILIGILAFAVGISGFQFMHKKEKLDFYHGLALKRHQLFAISYLAGLFLFLIPYISLQYLYPLENIDFTPFLAIYLLIYSIFTPNLSQYFQFGYFFFFLFF